MEGFGVLELLKTLLEKQPQGEEKKEEKVEESVSSAPSSSPQMEGINPYLEFARAHDARAKKIKK